MKGAYDQFQDEERRLVILQILECSAQYTASVNFLRTALEKAGLPISLRRFNKIAAELGDKELITICSDIAPSCTITEHGLDVARGLEVVEGVKRPAPKG